MTSASLFIDARIRRGVFLAEVSCEIESGRTTVLLGPNGAGKSTLLDAVTGVAPIEHGRIALGGRIFDEISPGRSAANGARTATRDRGIGFVPQGALLFPHLSILENVAFPLIARGAERKAASHRAADWLERLGVARRADAFPGEISGGEAHRAALARALVGDPEILLLDEPLAAVDAPSRGEIRSILRRTLGEFRGPRILVTHDPIEAAALGERLVVMENGRIVQQGTASELRHAPASAFVASFSGLNVLRGVAKRENEMTRIEGPAGTLWSADVSVPEGASAIAVVRPSAVTLFRAKPETSARNLFEAEIRSIRIERGHARVEIGSMPELIAEVTPSAVRALELEPGGRVWASIKASEVEVELG